MKISKKPNETAVQLIKRFQKATVNEGIVEEFKEKQFFLSEREKELLKKKKKIRLHY